MNFLRPGNMRWPCLLGLVIVYTASAQQGPNPLKFQTTVEPLPTDNLAGPCSFELVIPAPQKPVRAVWITYDRGYDIERYYRDADVIRFAQEHALALMLAHQCPAKDPPTGERGEMDMDPSRGIGRSIFTALDNFAAQSQHAEISSAKLILLGFSGTGALFAQFVKYAPDRVLAAILTNSGQSDPYGLDRLHLSGDALAVPQFIIVGGADDRAGTQRPFEYVRRHLAQGAPWAFLVQNGIPHCCVVDAKALVLEWVDQMVRLRAPVAGAPLLKLDDRKGWTGFIRPCPTSQRDHWGEPLWNVCGASVQLSRQPAPADVIPGAWFPTHQLARDWQLFIQQKEHPATSFPDGLDAAHSRFSIHK